MANLDMDTASLQYIELAAAQAASSDLDYAFELQLQEALAASTETTQYHHQETAQSASNSGDNSGCSEMGGGDEGEMTLLLRMQALEFEKFQQEVADHKQAEEEMQRLSEDICRKNHDAKFARSIQAMPEDEWEATGDDYEKPFDAEQISKDDRQFKLYYKGMISAENLDGTFDHWDTLAGAGIAIYDSDDNLILKLRKQLGLDMSRAVAEYSALKEGLMAAFDLGIRNVTAHGDCSQVHNQVIGRWNVRQRKIVKFHQDVVDQVHKLDKLFMVLIPRCENRVALTLAREAIDSQLNKRVEHVHEGEKTEEHCSICLEDINVSKMHEIMTCRHRFCFSCVSQHVEVKLTHGCVPSCPHEGCTIKLTVDGCKSFLSSKWVEVWTKRLEEAAIPESDKVYCPYPNCSALMTLSGIDRSRQACSSSHPFPTAIGRSECHQCHKFFCIECRVPWHNGMSCQEYQRRAPQLLGVDAKLHLLAKNNRWKRCTKCKHMIELAEGCNHMTCRMAVCEQMPMKLYKWSLPVNMDQKQSRGAALNFAMFVVLNGRIRKRHVTVFCGMRITSFESHSMMKMTLKKRKTTIVTTILMMIIIGIHDSEGAILMHLNSPEFPKPQISTRGHVEAAQLSRISKASNFISWLFISIC